MLRTNAFLIMNIFQWVFVIILLNICFNDLKGQETNERVKALKNAYLEFDLGFKAMYRGFDQLLHLRNAKDILEKTIVEYPDGWDNIIEQS